MNVFFAWIEENEVFDPTLHCRMDEDIFSLEIQEEEHHFPKACLIIKNPRCGFLHPDRKHWAFISVETKGRKQLLFKGALQVIPLKVEGETLEIELIAEPSDSLGRQRKLFKRLRKRPYWDPLFVREGEEDDPVEVLDGRSGFLSWSRTTHELVFSNLFQGRSIIDLGKNHFRDGFQIRLSELPLSSIHVKVSVKWVQRAEGLIDLSTNLKRPFEEGFINSLTGPSLVQRWWREGERLGRSGYWIESTWIQEIKPSYTGVLNLYPTFSDPISVSPFDPKLGQGEKPRRLRIKRYWYKAELVVGWSFKVRRREEVDFTLHHATQLPPTLQQKSRTLHLKLQRVTEEEAVKPWCPQVRYKRGSIVCMDGKKYSALQNHLSSSSFKDDVVKWQEMSAESLLPIEIQRGSVFRTDRGHEALLHAIEVAKSHLAASARAVEIEVVAPFESCLDISCDHSLSVEDDRIPQKKVTGKVKSYRLLVDGKTGKCFAHVKLGLSLGAGPQETSHLQTQEDYCERDFCDLGVHAKWTSPSGISFSSFHFQGEHDPLCFPFLWQGKDVVEEILVSNPASHQNRLLKQQQYPYGHHLEETLRGAETDIQIRLKNVRPIGVLCRRIRLEPDQAWSAPRHMDLTVIQ